MTAKIIAHSKSSINGKEIITFELEYGRIIHSELMTHRLFSRNAASSRAIPIDKLIKLVEDGCAMPAEWGLNQAGMQAKGTHTNPTLCRETWLKGAKRAVQTARELQALGLHKQICNRPLEPFQYMKTIVTATEWDNWFWLRDHKDADPTIRLLAEEMLEAKRASKPIELKPGEYHLPYITTERLANGKLSLSTGDKLLELDDAIKISVSCCAQVSYRVLDDSLDKALRIYDQLIKMSRVHASPFEHVATPMGYPKASSIDSMVLQGHKDSNGDYWSGNFKGWYQYRQEIPNNTCWGNDNG